MNGLDTPDDPSAPNPSPPVAASDPLKSMKLFFIDNQAGWPEEAVLAGDLVLWPDDGKYPSFTPVASAKHPAFDGQIIVQAGNRGLIISLCPGAVSMQDVRRILSAKGELGPEQYRVAVDAIVHRLMLYRAAGPETDAVHPFALLQWMQKANPMEAAIIQKALKLLYAKPEGIAYPTADGSNAFLNRELVHQEVEGMLDQLSATLNPSDIIKPVSGDAATTTTTE